MSAIGGEAVRIARGWIGTPYMHQASARGAGADCLGLLRGVWRGLYGAEPETVPPYTMDWSEPSHREVLWQAAERHLIALPEGAAGPGEVLLFRMRRGAVAKHLGISARTGAVPTFIHAYSGHMVVENPLSAPWARRIVARLQFPERRS
ncbi:peptidase [Maritimibacter sp. 55A14]|uniref:peptidase n=1 Tax=Maritimibacter sp. 55A14 TaxID=2174844 RepID=UPI000D60703A|nr:peptidase [Maritimibacter sp. 55A14]PWE30656.1 peptidase [Maritimibacter sp. 55A14]